MEDGRTWVRPVIAVAFVASILAAVAVCFFPRTRAVPEPAPHPTPIPANVTPAAAPRPSPPPESVKQNIASTVPASAPAKATPSTNAAVRAQGTAVDPAMALLSVLEMTDALARQAALQKIFAAWAASDTQTAFEFADTLPDPADQDAALQAIQSVAPVGIGVALRMENGFPLIFDLVPGSMADMSGQVGIGDVILAVGQGDGGLISVQGMPMEDIVGMVRGAPGTPVDLVVIPADAGPGEEPAIIELPRAQIIFKNG